MHRPLQYIARLSDKLVLNSKYTKFSFELVTPNVMEFTAGQYISIAMPAGGYRRSYSLCSTPNITHGFELLVDVVPNGMGVKYLNSLKFGDQINFLGPIGLFTVAPEVQAGPLVFVATASGIAPFRSMILDQLQIKQHPEKIQLYWGSRRVEELFWQDEFEELMTSYPQFQFHPVISQPLAEWPLCRGRVTDCLLVHQLIPNAHYYLCGNAAMIEDMITLLMKRGVPKDSIHREKFY
jgi:ferredoxin-NADP reductase